MAAVRDKSSMTSLSAGIQDIPVFLCDETGKKVRKKKVFLVCRQQADVVRQEV